MTASFGLLFIHHHRCLFPHQILAAHHLHSHLQLLPHLLHQWFHHWDEQTAASTSHPLYMHAETPRAVLETESSIDGLFMTSMLSFLSSLVVLASEFKSRNDEVANKEEEGD